MLCLLRSSKTALLITTSEAEIELLGEMIGRLGYPGLAVLLHGGLGAGKTLLTKGIGKALGCSRVKSPTFILVSEHKASIPLVHADLYRLNSHVEADALDFENYIDDGCILVVEWAERWHTSPSKDALDIRIKTDCLDENKRLFEIKAMGERAEKLLGFVLDELPFE